MPKESFKKIVKLFLFLKSDRFEPPTVLNFNSDLDFNFFEVLEIKMTTAFEPTVVIASDYLNTFSNVSIEGCNIVASAFDDDSVVAISSKKKPSLIVVISSKSSGKTVLHLQNNWETKDIPVFVTQSLSVNEIASEIRLNLLLRTNVMSFRR